jgi:glycine/serine hydroxymethyltransferase
MISEVLLDLQNPELARQVRGRVLELTARFPLPY